MTYCMIYMTAPTFEEGQNLARILIDKELVACVNLFPSMYSIYRWEGKIQEGGEVAMIGKTRQTLVPQVIEAVKEAHSYECPCVISWRIEDGNPAYLKWLEDVTNQGLQD